MAKLSSTRPCSTYTPSSSVVTFTLAYVYQTHALFTTDPRAISHVLTHSDEFCKTADAKAALEILGEGTHLLTLFVTLGLGQ